MMDPSIKNLPPGDPKLIENIVNQLKSQGIFDEFRRDCLADVDTKPAYQNLQHRVENFASDFLKSTQWRPDLNKNQLRDGLRRHINESGMLTTGVDRIIDQIVNPKIIQIFFPKITEIVRKLFGIDTLSLNGTQSEGFGSDPEPALAIPKPVAVSLDNLETTIESKPITVKLEPVLAATAPDIVQPESSPYIDAIEEQLLVLTGAHEYMKLEQLHGSPVSEPASKSNSVPARDRNANAEKEGEAKRDKVKEELNKKTDNVVKPTKKIDTKTAPKGKPSNSDKSRLNPSDKKPDKPIKREHSPSKTAGVSKSSSADSKGTKPLSSEKSRSSKTEDSSQKAKKLPDSKEGDDPVVKIHKLLLKSKSVEEKDAVKSRQEKVAKTDKSAQSSDKLEKSKPRVSETDKSFKNRSDKPKSPDKKPESSSSKHKSSPMDKSRHHHDDKSRSLERKSNSGSSSQATKSKDSERGKPGSTKSLAFGDKLCEPDKISSASKPKALSKPSTKDSAKAKPEQKSKSSSSSTSKTSTKKTIPSSPSSASKSDAVTKDSISNKVLKRQSSGSPDTSVVPKKLKQDDKPKTEMKTAKIVHPSPSKSQSSTSDSFSSSSSSSSSDDEEFKEFEATDVVSPSKIREEIMKKAGAGGDDGLSDVTVSSVHTSDLSDFDDRITLSESEEERSQSISPRKKSRTLPSSQEETKVSQPLEQTTQVPVAVTETARCSDEVAQKAVHQRSSEAEMRDKQEPEAEPRRELRRQRKLNPRYASDDFSSFFNTGKERQNHGHIFEHAADDLHREMPEMQIRGRRSTGHSTTTDDTEFPGSPISDGSELGELVKIKRGGRGKLCSPSESSDGDHSIKGPRSISSELNEGEEFRPRTSSQQSGCGPKRKQERSSPVDPIVSPKSDNSNGRRNSKVDSISESSSAPKRAPARYDNQRYSSTDLYKPRPVFTSSRRRAASPNKPNSTYGDFGPLVIDESAGQDVRANSESHHKGKRRQVDQNPSSTSKRRR